MNYWTQLSCEFAQQRNYLDEIYRIYPIISNLRREISENKIGKIKSAFDLRENSKLIKELLGLKLFPVKDSYVAFLKCDKTAIERNPNTVNRIAGNLYQLGFEQIIDNCTQPKESNRQMGPMFKRWIDGGALGARIIKDEEEFLNCNENCILNIGDTAMKNFAERYLGYRRDKGLDFIARFNGIYVIAEAKFITDFGGHQTGQFDDAVNTLQSTFEEKIVENQVIAISIMDGVIYIKNKRKFYKYLKENPDKIILSALLLREFLYSL